MRLSDAIADRLPPTDVAVANVTLDVVEVLAPRLDARVFVASGFLSRERPALPGYRSQGRAESEGWAAEVLSRETE